MLASSRSYLNNSLAPYVSYAHEDRVSGMAHDTEIEASALWFD